MKILRKGYNSRHKVAEYEFLAEVDYFPLYFILKYVRVKLSVVHGINGNSWERSITVKQSEAGNVIQVLISSYLEEVDFFKINS